MTLDMWLRVFSILLGPLAAVCITLWYTSRKEKREGKRQLFLTLMAHRKSVHLPESVNALNTISVIFAEHPQVVARWYEYFDIVSQRPEVNWTQAGHAYLRMLSEMARVLGYKKIDQVDIDKYYLPQGHVDQADFQARLQTELLRVLENTSRFETMPKADSAVVTSSQTNSITS